MNIDRFAYDEDTAEVECPACHKMSTVKVIDDGIGATEYWGSVSVHHCYVLVTTCCYEEVSKDEIK